MIYLVLFTLWAMFVISYAARAFRAIHDEDIPAKITEHSTHSLKSATDWTKLFQLNHEGKHRKLSNTFNWAKQETTEPTSSISISTPDKNLRIGTSINEYTSAKRNEPEDRRLKNMPHYISKEVH